MPRGDQAPVKAPQVSSPLELTGFESGGTGGSDRAFGIVFFVAFAVVGLLPLTGGGSPRTWALATAGLLLAAAVVRPRWLSSLNRVWFRFGMVLHRIASPVILTAIYYAVVTPTGLLLRLLKKDVLNLKPDAKIDSYWIARDPPGPSPESLERPY